MNGSDSCGGVILRLSIGQLQPGLYEYQVAYGSDELASDAGFTSISATLEAAAQTIGGVRGFEVAYGGLVVGTYPMETVRNSADAIALHAVEMAAALRDD